MNKVQKNYIDCLVRIESLLGNSQISDGAREIASDVRALRNEIEQRELIVPVVGAFSAGKSSLLNAIVGENWLPVGLTPETATPAELRYSETERLEVEYNDGQIETKPIADLAKVQAEASKVKVVRVYGSSDQLRAIEPMVLTDMPGFNSPLDEHNKAIEHYIGKGAHYIFVVSAEEGSLHNSTLGEISATAALGRSFSICINKTDLRQPEDVQAIREYIADQLTSFGLSGEIKCVSNRNTCELQELMSSIDPSAIWKKLYSAAMKQIASSIVSALDTEIEGRKQDKEKNDSLIVEMEESISRLEAESKKQQAKVEDGSASSEMARDIVQTIENMLTRETERLAKALNHDPKDLERDVTTLVRNGLVVELKNCTDEMSHNTIDRIAKIAVGSAGSNLKISTDWTESILEVLQGGLLPQMLSGLKINNKAVTGGASTLSGLLFGLATLIPHPVLKTVAMVLSPLADVLAKTLTENARLENAKEAIRSQLIPQITEKLLLDVEAFLMEVQRQTTELVVKAFEDQLEIQRKTLLSCRDNVDLAAVAESIALLGKIKEEMTALIEGI